MANGEETVKEGATPTEGEGANNFDDAIRQILTIMAELPVDVQLQLLGMLNQEFDLASQEEQAATAPQRDQAIASEMANLSA